MTFKKFGKVSLVALAVALAGCATQAPQQHSGFLGDYSQLQQTTDADGNPVARAINPNFNPKNYNAVLLDPVIFYPEPQPTADMSQASLDGLRAYLNQSLQTQMGKVVRVTNQAGPGVLRVRVAITSLTTAEADRKAYQYIPIAFVISAGRNAVEGKPEESKLFVEIEVTDSVTGQRMMSAVRSGSGEQFRPKTDQSGQMSVVDSLKPMIDKWVKGAVADAPKFVQGR